ncbi:MAG: HAD hydrolase family protein [Lachnospiraceae bacterium]|nr:HAD hydrolase family protein [Lachnospiraceae bacterium]
MQIGDQNKKKKQLPHIGLRIIKSAVAVFMCYIVDFLRAGNGIVFYSQLSALWCMQDYTYETRKNARQRTVGTMIGAIYGLVVLVIFTGLRPEGTVLFAAKAVIVALSIIPIIYTTVVLDKRNASYFSCVVFLSIVVNHANDVNPYIFVLNRVLDTMIGIAIGVSLNTFRFRRKKNTDTLFISGLDDTLFNENNNMSPYSRVELNRMIDEGLNFTISTLRTPASLIEPLSGIRLKLPVIAMDGAALYNIAEKRFEKVYTISRDAADIVAEFLESMGVSFFTNIVVDDTVLIYYRDSENEIYNRIVSELRKSPYRNYINRPVPKNEDVVYYMTIDKKEKILDLKDSLCNAGFDSRLRITITDSSRYTGCAYLKIYNHNASKQNMTDYLLKTVNISTVTTFGTIPGKYTYLIEPGDSNAVVKLIKHDFER